MRLLRQNLTAKELQNEWIKIREEHLYNRRWLSDNEYMMVKEGKIKADSIKGVLTDKDREIK